MAKRKPLVLVSGVVQELPAGDTVESTEAAANKDVSDGYAGLTAYKINMKNVAGTFTSYLTNTNTASRIYAWQDKDGTVALTNDITGGTSAGSFTTLAASGNVTLGDATTDTLNVGNGGIIKDANGNVGIGASPTGSNAKVYISGTMGSGTSEHAQLNAPTFQASTTSSAFAHRTSVTLNASAYSLAALYHYSARLASIGGATVASQYGFIAESTLTGATNNYGFYGAIEAGSGRYNFYAGGTARNVFMGGTSFGVVSGGGGASGHLRIGYNVTGATSAISVLATPSVQSDVTTTAVAFQTQVSTQDTAFTLSNLYHYQSVQGTITGGSRTAPTTQVGFQVSSSLTGATNNYGFRGDIPAGMGRYNFYATGTAQNSFSGDVLIHGAGGMGYTTGSGGTVTQATSRTTGVTINKTNGAITLVSAAGSTSWQSFTVTNSTVAATDVIKLSQKSGTDLILLHVTNVAAGSFRITFCTTGGTTTEQPVINFAVIKAATA